MTSSKSVGRRGFLGLALGAVTVACSRKAAPPPPPNVTSEAEITSAAPIAKRRLGRTNLMVSMIGIGGAHLGRTKDEAEALRIVRAAIDHGITFLDNCWDYNGGASEERMGKALKDGYRQRAFLMTKLDGRTKDAANAQLEQSLRRLGTDVIDLVQVHEVIRATDPDRVFAAGGMLEALVAAKQAGKIRFLGFTGHKDPSIHLAMLKAADDHGFTFDTVQMPINVMDAHYRSFAKDVLPVAQQHDMGVIGMKCMGDGHVLKSGAVTPQECLRYSLSQPVSVLVTGCDSLGVLQQAIDVVSNFKPLTDEERAAINAKTAPLAKDGKYEPFKTTTKFDGTTQHPSWLESAEL